MSAAALVATGALGACASGATSSSSSSTPAQLKVALVLPGTINDKSFNQVAYDGLKQAVGAVGATMAYSENVSDANARQVLRDYGSRGFDLVIAHSFSYQNPTIDLAPTFPLVKFMVGTGNQQAANVGTYQNPDYQGAYLAGILAAGATKTGTLGWVGTLPTPNLLANYHAFEAGAQSYKPSAKVLHALIGSYYDLAKTKEAALAQIQLGADVLEEQSVGVIDAAVQENVLAIGTLVDENSLGPNNVLTSVTWDLGPLYTDILKAVQGGSWTNQDWSYGLKEGSLALAPFHGVDSHVAPDALKLHEQKLAEIKAGTFTVPRTVTSI